MALHIIGIAVLLSGIASLGVVGVALQPVQSNTPISTTLKWKNERDLLLLMDSSSNQVLLANTVVAQCLEDTGLTDDQRRDGFTIAGHTYYNHDLMDEAKEAFVYILDIGQPLLDGYTISDAHRMVGQINLLENNFTDAYTHYKSAYDIHISLLDAGEHHYAYAYVSFVAHCAEHTGQLQIALDHVDEGVSLFDPELFVEMPRLLEIGGDVAVKMGESNLALSYYQDILDNFPSYGSGNQLTSDPVRIHAKIAAAQGVDLFGGCDGNSIERAFEITMNTDYDGMVSQIAIATSLVDCLIENNELWSAHQLSERLIEKMDIVLANPVLMANEIYREDIRKFQCESLFKSSKSAIRLGVNYSVAASNIQRIETEFSDVNQVILSESISLYADIPANYIPVP